MPNQYVRVLFADGVEGYQVIANTAVTVQVNKGVVTGYVDLDGNVLFSNPPIGIGCEIVDEAPPAQPWMT